MSKFGIPTDGVAEVEGYLRVSPYEGFGPFFRTPKERRNLLQIVGENRVACMKDSSVNLRRSKQNSSEN
jgi:hypothetical protein